MLEFSSVSKKYRQKRKTIHALKNVSFNVNEGEVFGFIGPNGAGKSTTIKIMLDVIRDYEGTVKIFGTSARNSVARQGVSYLPESPVLYEQFTPLEILRMSLRMYGIQRKDEHEWCMHWLERFSVSQYAQRRIRQLSKGNVQRVALAHTMVASPKLLVLDEPLSGLDPVGRKDVIDILQEYKSQGGAIFFTSHVLHDVERMADRFGFINHGELITTREPRELIQKGENRFIVRYQNSNSDQLCVGKELRKNEFEHEVNQNELPQFLEEINKFNGKVFSINPAISLESVFFQILREDNLIDKQ